MRPLRRVALLSLALLSVFTLAAGVAVAHLLPARLALWRLPTVAAHRLAGASPVLSPVPDPAAGPACAAVPTAAGSGTGLSTGPVPASGCAATVGSRHSASRNGSR